MEDLLFHEKPQTTYKFLNRYRVKNAIISTILLIENVF